MNAQAALFLLAALVLTAGLAIAVAGTGQAWIALAPLVAVVLVLAWRERGP